jgi:hypothetical protein
LRDNPTGEHRRKNVLDIGEAQPDAQAGEAQRFWPALSRDRVVSGKDSVQRHERQHQQKETGYDGGEDLPWF